MNIVLDVLKLRRVRLDYVSPPICPPLISGSSLGVFVEAVEGPSAPTGLLFTGQCGKFLTWTAYPGLICMSLYRAQDPGNPMGPATLIQECVSAQSVSVASPGWWTIAPVFASGQVGPQSDPVLVANGGSPVLLTIPVGCDIVGYAVFKNPDPTDKNGTYTQVLSLGVSQFAFEVTDDSGCYRIQAITDKGISELSAPLCRDQEAGCCPPQPCATQYAWDPILCSCFPDAFSGILGPEDIACINSAYASYLEAANATGPCFWELIGGSLPTGLTLVTGTVPGNTTLLTGTPTAFGDFSFTVRATDVYGTAKENTFTISVWGMDQSGALAGGTTDTAYSQQLTVTGGTPPYSFALVSGSLPTDLVLSSSGLISGTPFIFETQTFSVSVTDDNGNVCISVLSIDIEPCPNVITYPTIAAWNANVKLNSDLDRHRRIWWLREGGGTFATQVGLIDTQALVHIGFATDSLNIFNTVLGALGDTVIVDSKYSQCVSLGASKNVWFDLDTKDIIAVTLPGHTGNITFPRTYDAVRGLIYGVVPALSGPPIRIYVTNCARNSRAESGPFSCPAGVTLDTPSDSAYCPEANRVYLGSTGGGCLYHTWNAADQSVDNGFVGNLTPAGSLGPAVTYGVRYIRTLGLIAIESASGISIIQPHPTDPTLDVCVFADATFNAGLPFAEYADYNVCRNKFYLDSASGGAAITEWDGVTFAHANVPGSSGTYRPLVFDENGNRLLALNLSTKQVETFP